MKEEFEKETIKIQKKLKKMSKKEKDAFFKEMFKDSIKSTEIHNAEFYMNPEVHFPINEVGELHLKWFNQRFAYLKMEKYMPTFDRAFKLLTERGNFSRRNAFGEMHCDGFLWVEKCEDVQVIVEERQSFKTIYMKSCRKFHVRELAYQWNYPSYRKTMLKECTLKKLREQGFKEKCDYKTSFLGLLYGDARDRGYLLSMDLEYTSHLMPDNSFPIFKKSVDHVGIHTLSAIESLKFWECYLDDPTQLE